jgi:ubiquinol-cytochrome c reductase cytochrome c1 subunit
MVSPFLTGFTRVAAGAALVIASLASAGASESGMALDRAPAKANDVVSLQSGARTFVNYCLNCHAAAFMRYTHLQDIGLTETQIRDNLLFTGARIGDVMKVAMDRGEAKQWFGVAPPDLTLAARARSSGAGSGADWIYTYLRTFYRDPTRPTGWNNLVYPSVAMPHVLWQLSGEYDAVEQTFKSHEEAASALRQQGGLGRVEAGAKPGEWVLKTLKQAVPGTQSALEYDRTVADLVNYMAFMAEPARAQREKIGVIVLLYLGLLFVLAWLLKKEYWRDVH